MTATKKKPASPANPNLVDPQAAGDVRLLAEFQYAADHWLPAMSAAGKKAALDYAKSKSE